MVDWSMVTSGTMESALDLGIVSGAMRNQTSPDVSALKLVMTAPQGWPGWATDAVGGEVVGNTLSLESRLPWLGTGQASVFVSPFRPLLDVLVQDAIMTSGPISWTLYQQVSTAGRGISNPLAKIVAQNVDTAAQEAGKTLSDALGLPKDFPVVPVGVAALLLVILLK